MTVISDKFDAMAAEGRLSRLGILGGTFDPIHFGHFVLAEQAYDELELDGVLFIPNNVPVFKQDVKVAPASHRLEMVRIATRSNPHFDYSSIEVDRGGITYTADTLLELGEHYGPKVKLFFIAGVDAIRTLPKWKDAEKLAKLATFVGVNRPGASFTDDDRAAIAAVGNFDIVDLHITGYELSSSQIRERVSEGKTIRYLTKNGVIDYINNNFLYQD